MIDIDLLGDNKGPQQSTDILGKGASYTPDRLGSRTPYTASCARVSLALGHPFDKHLIELIVHFFQSFALFLEETAGDGVVRAGRGNVGFVVNNNEKVTNVIFVVKVRS
jgi:hypothetical protein